MNKFLRVLFAAACIFTVTASVASEQLALRVPQIKMMRALHSLPEHTPVPDLQELRTGPGFQGTFPLYFAFGVDGCFAGFFTVETVERLDFTCRFDAGLVSLASIIGELRHGATTETFGLANGRAQVLVAMPAMMSKHCDPCSEILDKVRELGTVEQTAAQVSIVDVQL